jgi:alanine dehydrogenase
VLRLAETGLPAAVRADPALAKGVNTWGGQITHPAVAQALGVAYTQLETLL